VPAGYNYGAAKRGMRLTTDENFHDGVKITTIATPREQFVSCSPDEIVADVAVRNTEKFDFMPVQNVEGVVLGVVKLASYFDVPAPAKRISDFLIPLGEQHLIGADASILAFLLNADEYRFRFVVSQHGIIGLVSLSDLQKLPARATLFSLVTALELKMLELIRSTFPQVEDWQKLISERRRKKISEQLLKAKAADGIVDELLYTQLCDKRDILLKSLLRKHEHRDLFSKDMRAIESLRNSLAHANHYADTSAKAADVCRIVRAIFEIYGLLESFGAR
jgi:hypothetical protein